jgi:hypothetical protein
MTAGELHAPTAPVRKEGQGALVKNRMENRMEIGWKNASKACDMLK